MTDYRFEASFRAYNELGQLVDVQVTFNIDEDDTEVLEFDRLVFKRCYGIELGHVTAWLITESEPYQPSKEDLEEWNHDIKHALQREFKRQVA